MVIGVFLLVLQHLYIPVTLRTAEGSLNVIPDKLVLNKCFPVGLLLFFVFVVVIYIFNSHVERFIHLMS